MYYHTAGVREKKDFTPHGSIYAPSFYGSEKNVSAFRQTIKDITPPILVRGFQEAAKSQVTFNCGNYERTTLFVSKPEIVARQPMKILLVHNTYQQAGGEDVVFQQEKKNLQRGGHHVSTYERSNHEIEKFSALQRAPLIKTIVWNTDSRREFAQLLARESPDVVHVHNTFIMISPSIYSACREQGVPVVQTLQNYRLMCPGALFFRDGKVCEECVEHSLWRGIQHGCYRDSHCKPPASR